MPDTNSSENPVTGSIAGSNSYEPRGAWEIYAGKRQELRESAREYINFISACKTERETIAWAMQKLLAAGYSEDFNSSLIMRPLRGKALFAARRGKKPLRDGFNLIAAHVDSPRLDFKQHPFREQAGLAQARTHYYGGIRKYQWLARPLALHGVVALENGETVEVNIGDKPGEPVFCIADLLPHLAQKQAGEKLSEAFDAEKLNIIVGHEPVIQEKDTSGGNGADNGQDKNSPKAQILNFLHEKYGIREEDLITAEMEAVPAGPAALVGFDEALVGGYGQDDRICVYCALNALLDATASEPENCAALILWDKEEIGSDGASGASSRFFQYCVDDLIDNWDKGGKAAHAMLQARAISADVTAALDPDYPDVHEKQNAAKIGFGPCFSKFTGSRGKYGASEADAEFFASLRGMLNAKNIPWQAAELGKVDLGGGGTVALFLAAYGMRVIDLGPALLSMHSPFELSSVADLYATRAAYSAFLQSAD